jgi:hypothetical protein
LRVVADNVVVDETAAALDVPADVLRRRAQLA